MQSALHVGICSDANFWVIIILIIILHTHHRTSMGSTEVCTAIKQSFLSCHKSLQLIFDGRHRMTPFVLTQQHTLSMQGGVILMHVQCIVGGGLRRLVANTHFAVGFFLSSPLVVYSARVSVSMSIELQTQACYMHGTCL